MADRPCESYPSPPKRRLQFTLADLFFATTGTAVSLAVLNCSGSWQLAVFVGLFGVVTYVDCRLPSGFPGKTRWFVMAALVLSGIILVYLSLEPVR